LETKPCRHHFSTAKWFTFASFVFLLTFTLKVPVYAEDDENAMFEGSVTNLQFCETKLLDEYGLCRTVELTTIDGKKVFFLVVASTELVSDELTVALTKEEVEFLKTVRKKVSKLKNQNEIMAFVKDNRGRAPEIDGYLFMAQNAADMTFTVNLSCDDRKCVAEKMEQVYSTGWYDFKAKQIATNAAIALRIAAEKKDFQEITAQDLFDIDKSLGEEVQSNADLVLELKFISAHKVIVRVKHSKGTGAWQEKTVSK